MSLDGFLTFLTLVIAVYALASPVVKLRAKLVFVVQVPLAIFTLLLVLYLQFFEFVGQPCPSALNSICEWLVFTTDSPITTLDAAFLVVITWMVFALVVHKYFPRLLGSLLLFRSAQLVDRLAYEQKYSELLEFVEPFLPLIGKASRRKLFLQKIHDDLEVMRGGMHAISHSMFDQEVDSRESQRSKYTKLLRRLLGSLSVIVPSQYNAQASADDIARVFFQNENLRKYIATTRPYFAVSLIREDMFGDKQFCEDYFSLLIANTGSVLYHELQNNQDRTFRYGYEIPESNRLLYFLFSDAQIANNLEVWRPIGDHIIKVLTQDKSSEFVSHINGRADYFENECWRNDVYVGVVFFDLMVTSAAYQGVPWHMWLYYTTYAVENLVKKYDTSDPSVDTNDEFPTISARLIYTIIDIQCDWVCLVSDLPDDSPHCRSTKLVESLERQWNSWNLDNNNIPMSAAMALGTCVKALFTSERIGDKFLVYMYEVILTAVKRLRREGFEGKLRNFLIRSIIHGGQGGRGGRITHGHAYGWRLITLLSKVDHVLESYVDDYVHELKKAYPDVPF